jgi:hypothetical protein
MHRWAILVARVCRGHVLQEEAMKRISVVLLFLCFSQAVMALAQGPALTAVPANPCGATPLVRRWVADQVGTNAGGAPCPAPGCWETMVVCHHRGPAADPAIDIVVELFSAAGAVVSTGSACGVAPGASAAFVTVGVPLLPPYVGTPLLPAAPVVPVGSLRVMSAGPNRAVCEVTLIDTFAMALVPLPGPLATKDVKVTRSRSPQRGD